MTSHLDRVLVDFPVDEGGAKFVERLYAVPLGDDLYCLDNSPFYAYGVSFGDVVRAPMVNSIRVFAMVVEHHGHSTYRVRLPRHEGHDYFLQYWHTLAQLGCTFEGSTAASSRLYAIDVPPSSDVAAVYRALEECESRQIWTFEEAHYDNERDRRTSH